jgi:hypothetical protein
MPSFKPKATKKIKFNKKSSITLDNKHKEFLNEFSKDENDRIPELKFERQELIMKEQDEALDDISDELKTIKYIAIKIGDEMDEHNVLLDDLKDNIDNTNSRVNAANKKIDLISRISENKYSVIIAILIIILIIMIVIYFS